MNTYRINKALMTMMTGLFLSYYAQASTNHVVGEVSTIPVKHGDVLAMAFNPNNNTLITGSGDGFLQIWDVTAAQELKVLERHKDQVRDVRFENEGKSLITCSKDGVERHWDSATWTRRGEVKYNEISRVNSAFSADGRYSAQFEKGVATVSSRIDGSMVRQIRLDKGTIGAIALSPNGKCLAVSSSTAGMFKDGNRVVTFWDVETGQAIAVMEGNKDKTRCMAFSEDGRFLASGGNDSMVKVWSINPPMARDPLPVVAAQPVPVPAPAPVPAAVTPSRPASAPMMWEPGKNRQTWVLVIGVGTYKSTDVPRLEYARRDAERIRDWGLKYTPQNNVHVLLDEQATRVNLLLQIDWLRKNAIEEDAVLVYFAGHGAPALDNEGKSVDAKYLVMHDTEPDTLFATGMAIDELTRNLSMVKAKTQVVILEACYTGPVGEKIIKQNPTADLAIRPRLIQEMGEKPGRVILSASSGRQMAHGSAELQGMLFTHYLLKSWEKGSDPMLTKSFDDVRDAVKRAATQIGSSQEPVKFGDQNLDMILKRAPATTDLP